MRAWAPFVREMEEIVSLDPAVASLFTAIAAAVLLAITSVRYGVDSREDFTEKNRGVVRRGIV